MIYRARLFADKVFRDTRAATSIEYALIAGSIAVVIITVVYSLGTTVGAQYESVQNGFE